MTIFVARFAVTGRVKAISSVNSGVSVTGSADLFDHDRRSPRVERRITSPFMMDLPSPRTSSSYHRKHNLANGEHNRDGSATIRARTVVSREQRTSPILRAQTAIAAQSAWPA